MPRDGSSTRDRILDVAEQLFIEQGYSATSLDQLLAESKSSKGAFFHHFESKADLADRLVARYVEGDLAQLQSGLDAVRSLPDPVERALAFVRYYEDAADELMSAQSGCLYATVLAEQGLSAGAPRPLIEKATVAWRDEFAHLLREALADREPAGVDGIDIDALADHLYVTFEGGFNLCRTLDERAAMRAQLRVFRQLLQALFAHGGDGRRG